MTPKIMSHSSKDSLIVAPALMNSAFEKHLVLEGCTTTLTLLLTRYSTSLGVMEHLLSHLFFSSLRIPTTRKDLSIILNCYSIQLGQGELHVSANCDDEGSVLPRFVGARHNYVPVRVPVQSQFFAHLIQRHKFLRFSIDQHVLARL